MGVQAAVREGTALLAPSEQRNWSLPLKKKRKKNADKYHNFRFILPNLKIYCKIVTNLQQIGNLQQ